VVVSVESLSVNVLSSFKNRAIPTVHRFGVLVMRYGGEYRLKDGLNGGEIRFLIA